MENCVLFCMLGCDMTVRGRQTFFNFYFFCLPHKVSQTECPSKNGFCVYKTNYTAKKKTRMRVSLQKKCLDLSIFFSRTPTASLPIKNEQWRKKKSKIQDMSFCSHSVSRSYPLHQSKLCFLSWQQKDWHTSHPHAPTHEHTFAHTYTCAVSMTNLGQRH